MVDSFGIALEGSCELESMRCYAARAVELTFLSRYHSDTFCVDLSCGGWTRRALPFIVMSDVL